MARIIISSHILTASLTVCIYTVCLLTFAFTESTNSNSFHTFCVSGQVIKQMAMNEKHEAIWNPVRLCLHKFQFLDICIQPHYRKGTQRSLGAIIHDHIPHAQRNRSVQCANNTPLPLPLYNTTGHQQLNYGSNDSP